MCTFQFLFNVIVLLQAKSLTDPFAYEDHRKSKIREKIEEARQSRVKVQVGGSL